MFDIPSDYTIEKIVVTEDSVVNNTKPLIRTNKKRKPIQLKSDDLKKAE